MEMNEFIADLEARAALIPSEILNLDRDLFDFCAHCRRPLAKSRVEYRRFGGADYCQACYDMRDVVSNRSHFAEAEREFQERQKRLNLLRPGSDYLGGRG